MSMSELKEQVAQKLVKEWYDSIPDGVSFQYLRDLAGRIARALKDESSLASVAEAYREGAEAMRERAAKHCLDQANDLRHNPTHRASAFNLGEGIRALPPVQEG